MLLPDVPARLFCLLVAFVALGCNPADPPETPRSPQLARSEAPSPVPAPTMPRERSKPADPPPIRIVVDDEPAGVWTLEQLDAIGRISVPANRPWLPEVWSLRDLVRELVAPGRSVTEVRRDRGRIPVTAEQWSDADATPVLRLNRKGHWKFEWIAPAGPYAGVELREIEEIRLSSATQ